MPVPVILFTRKQFQVPESVLVKVNNQGIKEQGADRDLIGTMAEVKYRSFSTWRLQMELSTRVLYTVDLSKKKCKMLLTPSLSIPVLK